MNCQICRLRPAYGGSEWCKTCCEAWDRNRRRDDGSIGAAMNWAVRRAWYFADKLRREREREDAALLAGDD